MQIVPVQTVQNQTLSVALGGQNCQINIYQKNYGLFFDLISNGVAIITGAKCLNYNPLIQSPATGFIGNFWFADQQGSNDPDWTGLGTRYLLEYLEAADVPATS